MSFGKCIYFFLFIFSHLLTAYTPIISHSFSQSVSHYICRILSASSPKAKNYLRQASAPGTDKEIGGILYLLFMLHDLSVKIFLDVFVVTMKWATVFKTNRPCPNSSFYWVFLENTNPVYCRSYQCEYVNCIASSIL